MFQTSLYYDNFIYSDATAHCVVNLDRKIKKLLAPSHQNISNLMQLILNHQVQIPEHTGQISTMLRLLDPWKYKMYSEGRSLQDMSILQAFPKC